MGVRLSHKMSTGTAAFGSPGFQPEMMDEWAPYRMAFLLLLVASSVALWASYKLLCEKENKNRDDVAYQPLSSVVGGEFHRQPMGDWDDGNSSIEDLTSMLGEEAATKSAFNIEKRAGQK